jgi:hypothetical protein
MRYVLFSLMVFVAACDAGNNTASCMLETDNTYTFSTPFVERSGDIVALFEFQQEVQMYETGNCRRTEEDVNEVSLVVRNLTACVHNLNYTVSLIQSGEGFSIAGSATIQPSAAHDQGIVQRGSPILISNAQAVVIGTSTLTNCP